MVRADVGAPPQAGDGDLAPDQDMIDGDPGRPEPDRPGRDPALTSPSVVPRTRIDWLFGRGVTFSRAEVLTGALTSDHLPLVVETAP